MIFPIRNKYLVLILLVTVFVSLRLAILFTSIHKLYDHEELYVGTIAKQVIEGMVLPFSDYPLEFTKGGILAWGLLCVPFFIIFGQSYLALKLVTLSAAAVILAISYLLLWEFFSHKAAVIAGFLFIFSPPLYTRFSLMSYGSHFEVLLFEIAALYVVYRIFLKEAPAGGRENVVCGQLSAYQGGGVLFGLFGLISGFGMFFNYGFLLTLCVCLLLWFILDKTFFLKRKFLLFLGFFIVGLSPWLYYFFTRQGANICLDVNDPARPLPDLFFSKTPLQSLAKLATLFVSTFPRSFVFEDFGAFPGRFLAWAYYVLFVLSFGVLIWLHRNELLRLFTGIVSRKPLGSCAGYRSAFLLFYFITFCLIFSFVWYDVNIDDEDLAFYGYRFLLGAYPFIFMIIALFLAWLWEKRKNAIPAVLFFCFSAVLLFVGIIGNSGLITARNINKPVSYEGYTYFVLGDVISRRYGQDEGRLNSLINKINTIYREQVYEGIGVNLGRRYWQDINTCIARVSQMPPKYRACALQGIGVYLSWRFKGYAQRLEEMLAATDPSDRESIYRGIGQEIGMRLGSRMQVVVDVVGKLDSRYRFCCYAGVGEAVAVRFSQDIRRCVEPSRYIKPEYRRYYFAGMGKQLGWRYRYYVKEPVSILAGNIPPGYRDSFFEGASGQQKE